MYSVQRLYDAAAVSIQIVVVSRINMQLISRHVCNIAEKTDFKLRRCAYYSMRLLEERLTEIMLRFRSHLIATNIQDSAYTWCSLHCSPQSPLLFYLYIYTIIKITSVGDARLSVVG